LSGSITGAVCTQRWVTKARLNTRKPILNLQPNPVSTKPGEGHIQVIEKNGKPEWAVIPYDEYIKIQELIEDIEDKKRY